MALKLKLKRDYNRTPSLLDQEQQDSVSSWSEAPVSDVAVNNTALSSEASASAAPKVSLMSGMASNPNMVGAIGAAGGAVGQAADPEGTGAGPVLSGAAQGAATGTMIMPGYGTAIGAAIGAGLGMIQADNKRKEIKRQTAANVQNALGQGLQNASQVQFKFRGNNGRKLNL